MTESVTPKHSLDMPPKKKKKTKQKGKKKKKSEAAEQKKARGRPTKKVTIVEGMS